MFKEDKEGLISSEDGQQLLNYKMCVAFYTQWLRDRGAAIQLSLTCSAAQQQRSFKWIRF